MCCYLHLLCFCLGQHRVVSFVLVCQTQVANAAPVGAAVHFQQLVVLGTDRLLEPLGGRNQLVLLEGSGLVVRLEVNIAVGGQAHQAGLDSLVFPPGADVTLHVVSFGQTSVIPRYRGSQERSCLEFLHHIGEHGVPGKRRSRAKALSALRADEDPEKVVLVPVVLDAVRAVAVSAGDGHWVFQHVQAYGAVKLVLVQNHSTLSHF